MTDQFEFVSEDLELPSLKSMYEELEELVDSSDAAARCLCAVRDGVFKHPDGRVDYLQDIRISPTQLALITHLAKRCPAAISVDVGFGMGSSATITLAARSIVGNPFQHIAFDPWGLPDNRGKIVQEYLDVEFSENFERIWKPSEIGLGRIFDEKGYGAVGFVIIDGCHTFDQVMVDFVMADLASTVGAYIVFDDAHFPAIETVIDYIRTNRPDYAVSHLPVVNTSIVQKRSWERPGWDAFKPFPVPMRRDWTTSAPDWLGDLSQSFTT